MKTSGPDGLEAWCVALSACFINFVMAGLGRMSGILYVVFIDIFAVDRKQAAVPFSARSLTRNLLGPVVGIIGQKYGVRAATLMGGIIGTISAAACFYAYNMLWITIMWGVFNGIGTALAITLPQVVLGLHFKKHKTTASGMAFSGGCVGSFLFPVLLEYLLWTYGLGGTFLIFAGIIMNVIPAAMILNKPSWMIKETLKNNPVITVNDIEERDMDFANVITERQGSINIASRRFTGHSNSFLYSERDENGRFSSVSQVIFSRAALADKKLYKNSIDIELLQENKKQILHMMIKYYVKKNGLKENKITLPFLEDNIYRQMENWFRTVERSLPGSFSGSYQGSLSAIEEVASGGESWKSDTPTSNDFKLNNRTNVNVNTTELFLTVPKLVEETRSNDFIILLNHLLDEDKKVVSKLFPQKQDINLLEQLRRVNNLYENRKSGDILSACSTEIALKTSQSEEFSKDSVQSNSFRTHIKTAFRLHANPLFLLISLCRCVHFLTFVPTVTIIVDFSMDKGILVEDGKYVIAALSLGDLLGRLCLGWVTDREYIGLPRYMLIVMVLQGACTASLPLTKSKISIFIGIAMFGILQGSLFVRHPVLVSKYLKSNEQSVAMGCFNFFSGLLGFTLPNYIGYFRDTIGFYDYMFYINGAIGAFVGALWIFEPILLRWCQMDPDSG